MATWYWRVRYPVAPGEMVEELIPFEVDIPSAESMDVALECCGRTFPRLTGQDPEQCYMAHRRAVHR
jgi:hypothetical protein